MIDSELHAACPIDTYMRKQLMSEKTQSLVNKRPKLFIICDLFIIFNFVAAAPTISILFDPIELLFYVHRLLSSSSRIPCMHACMQMHPDLAKAD